MAIDFPASPTLNQTFSVGNTNYVWDGTKWTASVTGGIALDKIQEGNTSAEVIDTGSDGRFVVTTEGSERLRVTSGGLVGIGTSSPNAPLDVFTSSGVAAWVRKSANPGAIGLASDTTPTTLLEGVSGGGLNVYTATGTIASPTYTSRLCISSLGNVGIGTSTPAELFDVNGKAIIRNALGVGGTNYGSSGQVLTSQGSGAAPQWASPATGAMVFISAVTASNSASVAFTSGIDSTYDVHMITYIGAYTSTNDVALRIRMSTNGGSSYDSNAGSYGYNRIAYGTLYPEVVADAFQVNDLQTNNDGPTGQGNIFFYSLSRSTEWTGIVAQGVNGRFSSTMTSIGNYKQRNAVNALQIYAASGTITSGTFRLYGIKNS